MHNFFYTKSYVHNSFSSGKVMCIILFLRKKYFFYTKIMCIILYIKSYLHNFFYRKSYVHKFFHFCISYTHNYSKVMCTILFSTEKNYMHIFFYKENYVHNSSQ
jgi:hypothetical protein